MDPSQVAKLDQAGAGLQDTARIVAGMAKTFMELGASADQALDHAINLLANVLYAQVPPDPEDT